MSPLSVFPFPTHPSGLPDPKSSKMRDAWAAHVMMEQIEDRSRWMSGEKWMAPRRFRFENEIEVIWRHTERYPKDRMIRIRCFWTHSEGNEGTLSLLVHEIETFGGTRWCRGERIQPGSWKGKVRFFRVRPDRRLVEWLGIRWEAGMRGLNHKLKLEYPGIWSRAIRRCGRPSRGCQTWRRYGVRWSLVSLRRESMMHSTIAKYRINNIEQFIQWITDIVDCDFVYWTVTMGVYPRD
jgi:hypothetical protein